MTDQTGSATGGVKRPTRFTLWLGTKSDGEKLGFGCLAIAAAIPAGTFIWLILQALLEGGCASACVTRGWAGVIAIFIAVPIGLVALVIILISSAVKKPRDN